MIITRLHLGITLLVAFALHASLAVWLVLPEPEPLPESRPSLRISLMAPVAQQTVAVAEPEPLPAPPPEPPPEPVPEPPPEKKLAEPVKPPPEVPIEKPVEPTPEPVAQPTPAPEPPPPPVTAPRAPLDAAAAVEYERLLVGWLEKHKRYPKRAKRLRIEGEALLRIRIDRTGHTLTVVLERSTGNRLLDQAALDMARRANPFPSMPGDDPRSELEFRVPVAFTMR